MFHITSDYQSEFFSDWCIFQIVFRLVSDWFQIGTKNFRLHLLIASDCSRLLQIASYSFQTGSTKKKHFRLAVWKKHRVVVIGFSPIWEKLTSGYHNQLLKGLNFRYMYCSFQRGHILYPNWNYIDTKGS